MFITSSASYSSNSVEKSVLEIDLVATVKFQPEYFISTHQFEFVSSGDDLDSLVFTSVDLPSGNTISLVRHQNAPYPGTEIYLTPGLSKPFSILVEALHILNLSRDDLD